MPRVEATATNRLRLNSPPTVFRIGKDTTPPRITYRIEGDYVVDETTNTIWIGANAKVFLVAEDLESGVAQISYRVNDSQQWTVVQANGAKRFEVEITSALG